MRKNGSADADNSLSELLRDMFIAILLLNGVTQDNVARTVRVGKARVNGIGKNLGIKGLRGERKS